MVIRFIFSDLSCLQNISYSRISYMPVKPVQSRHGVSVAASHCNTTHIQLFDCVRALTASHRLSILLSKHLTSPWWLLEQLQVWSPSFLQARKVKGEEKICPTRTLRYQVLRTPEMLKIKPFVTIIHILLLWIMPLNCAAPHIVHYVLYSKGQWGKTHKPILNMIQRLFLSTWS